MFPSPSHTGLTLLSALAPSSPPRTRRAREGSAESQTAPRGRTDFFRLDYSGYQGYVLLDLTELSSYLPLVPCFEFGNASGTLFPCTEGRVRTIMTSAGTPRAGAFEISRENRGCLVLHSGNSRVSLSLRAGLGQNLRQN